MTTRAMLVVVNETPLPGAFVVEHARATCATCRWAEKIESTFPFRDGRMWCGKTMDDYCVQWEGK